MELNQSGYSISELCKCARISRSSYYKWLNRKETQRDKENKEISNEIIKIYSEVKGIYGYRRITLNLNKTLGSNYNHKRIYRLMKSMNMSAVIRKKRKRYVHSTPQITAENLLNRNFTTDNSNKVWDTDVTYLIFKGSRAYLSTIIDLYDRHVVSYVISKRNDLKLVMDTLNKAISKEKDVHGLIIHSDQGFQYTSYEYKAICESNGIQISMSRKGMPIDDSPIESWHSLLKKETLYNNNITSLQEYIQLVEEWILFYNTTRLKSKVKKKRNNYTKREK